MEIFFEDPWLNPVGKYFGPECQGPSYLWMPTLLRMDSWMPTFIYVYIHVHTYIVTVYGDILVKGARTVSCHFVFLPGHAAA